MACPKCKLRGVSTAGVVWLLIQDRVLREPVAGWRLLPEPSL